LAIVNVQMMALLRLARQRRLASHSSVEMRSVGFTTAAHLPRTRSIVNATSTLPHADTVTVMTHPPRELYCTETVTVPIAGTIVDAMSYNDHAYLSLLQP